MSVGCIIDIDGVLIQGKSAVPGAREAILRLKEAGIPHVFVTNGGGLPKRAKAESIAHILQVDADSVLVGRMVQAHDPIVDLLKRDGVFDKRVLVLSKSEELSRGVCKEWELPNGVIIEDFERDCPWVWPTADDGRPIEAEAQERVAAICVVATPQNWGHSLQLTCDLLLNGGRLFPNTKDARPLLYVSNPDFDYRARPLLNRMTTGAWLECLRGLMSHYESVLEPILLGKPHAPIYDMAKVVLSKQVAVGAPLLTKLFAIGDNPISDIKGARCCGAHAVLVMTGVAAQDDPANPADTICASIVEAVDLVLLSTTTK